MSQAQMIESFDDSSESPCFSFLKIDHKNEMVEEDEESRIKQTLNFFTAVTSIDEEDSIGKEINKFFNQILPENSDNPLNLNKSIAAKNKISLSQIQSSLDNILNKKVGIDFYFSKNDIEDIVNVLTFSYKNLTKDIKKFDDLTRIVDTTVKSGTDFFKRYESQDYVVIENNENASSNNSNLFNHRNSSKTSPRVEPKKKSSIDTIKICKSIDNISIRRENFVYKYRPGKKGEFIIPVEMLILAKKFQTVRKIKLGISEFNSNGSNMSNTKKNYIFVFLNLNWIFSNVIEIEVDLSNESLYNDLFDVFHEKLVELAKQSNRLLKNTKYDTGYSMKRNFEPMNDEEEEEIYEEGEDENSVSNLGLVLIEDKPKQKKENIMTYEELVLKYKEVYEMIIVFSYFISTIKNLCVSSMIIPDCFKREILTCFIQNQVLLVNYNFFSFFSKISNLVHFTIDFNCLDMATFENLIGFIFKNNTLNTLQMSFFPPEEYFSQEMLLKLLFSSGLNINKIFPQKENKLLLNDSHSNEEEVDMIIVNKLLQGFEDNLNKFFSLLEKCNLNELVLLLDLPSIISNSEKYTLVLLKFLINLFLLLQSKDNHFITLTILANYLLFDNRKYPIINEFLNKLLIYKTPSIKLQKFSFQARFYCVSTLYRIIPYNIQFLSLGDLDFDSFHSIISYLTSRSFKSHSQLESLTLTVSNTITSYNLLQEDVSAILTHYPKSLKEVTLSTWLTTNTSQIKTLVQSVDYNTLEKIILEFGKITDREKRYCGDSFSSGGSSQNSRSFGKEFKSMYIVRTRKKSNIIIRLMNIAKQYNKKIMCLPIFLNIEKFFTSSYPKEIKIKSK